MDLEEAKGTHKGTSVEAIRPVMAAYEKLVSRSYCYRQIALGQQLCSVLGQLFMVVCSKLE